MTGITIRRLDGEETMRDGLSAFRLARLALGVFVLGISVSPVLGDPSGSQRFTLRGAAGTIVYVTLGPQTDQDAADRTYDGAVDGTVSGVELEATPVTLHENADTRRLVGHLDVREELPERPSKREPQVFTFYFTIDPGDATNENPDDPAGVVRTSENPSGNERLEH